MAPQAKIGIITTIIGFVAGVWIFLAPFIVEYQKVGQDWIEATRNDLWSGGALMAVSALTLLLFSAFALRDADRDARRRNLEQASQEG